MSGESPAKLDTVTRGRLRDLVASRRQDAVAWLRELVATLSVAPEEDAAQRVVAGIAREAGLDATLLPCDDELESDPRFVPTGLSYRGRSNCIVRIPGAAGPPLLCNAHIDTVPAGEGWTHPPTGRLVGGRFYGLGACDTKASTVAALIAAASLHECTEWPPALVLHSVLDEEPGGNGTLALLRSLQPESSLAWLAVVMEPTALRVTVGHRGMLWYRVECVGRQAHGSTAEGVNAIEIAGEVALAVRRLNAGFEAWDPGDYGSPRANVGIVHGGTDVYTTPGRCSLEMSVRYAPGERERVSDALERAVGSVGGTVRMSLVADYEAAQTVSDDARVRAVQDVLAAHGLDQRIDRLTGTCDMRHYRHLLEMPSVIFGPGDLRNAHAADEYVEIDEILLAAGVLAELAWHRGTLPTR